MFLKYRRVKHPVYKRSKCIHVDQDETDSDWMTILNDEYECAETELSRHSLSEYMKTIRPLIPQPSARYSSDSEYSTYYNEVCEKKSAISIFLDWIESANEIEFKQKILHVMDVVVKTVVIAIFIFALIVILIA